MTARERWFVVMISGAAIGYFPFGEWLATARSGTVVNLFADLIFNLRLLYVLLAIAGIAVVNCIGRSRAGAMELILLGLLYVVCCFVGIRLGQQTRMAGMKAFTERAKPLVAAIHQYEREHHAPPETLKALVPRYLPKIPSTGMRAYPGFVYLTGADCRQRYHENPWALFVATPLGFVNGDCLLYFPRQNYPERGYGGSLERVGDWAYVHE